MRNIIAVIALFAMVFAIYTPVNAQSGNQKIILQGGITKNVPKTPTEVQRYLVQMKAIMAEYDRLSMQLTSVLQSGRSTGADADHGRTEWIRLANKIDQIVPPYEVATSHKQLANSLRNSSKFLKNTAGMDASQKSQIMMAMLPVISNLSQSISNYSHRVDVVIATYGLDPKLNPIAANGATAGGARMGSLNMGGLGALGGMGGLGGLGGLGGAGIDLQQLQNLKLK